MPFEYRHALITGASSGIGLQLAYDLGKLGVHLFLVSNESKALQEAVDGLGESFPDIQVDSLSIDLSEEKSALQLYQTCQERNLTIDLLVNNAGYGNYGFINELSMDRELNMLKLHIWSPYQLTRCFLDDMLASDHGCIVNVSSISAFQPNPRFSTYGASKAFLLNWTRAIAEDIRLQKKKVKAIAICPTPVRTKFAERSKMLHSVLHSTWMTVDRDLVSREIIRAIKNYHKILIPGRFFHFLNIFASRLPMSWKVALSRIHLIEKKHK